MTGKITAHRADSQTKKPNKKNAPAGYSHGIFKVKKELKDTTQTKMHQQTITISAENKSKSGFAQAGKHVSAKNRAGYLGVWAGYGLSCLATLLYSAVAAQNKKKSRCSIACFGCQKWILQK